jgi:L-asparaginase
MRALLAAGVHGIVLAATGNGTVHHALQPALDEAMAAGVPVWRATRCAEGALVGRDAGPAAAMTPWQARVELLLTLLLSRCDGGA